MPCKRSLGWNSSYSYWKPAGLIDSSLFLDFLVSFPNLNHFSDRCIEMLDSEHPEYCFCSPEGLLGQVGSSSFLAAIYAFEKKSCFSRRRWRWTKLKFHVACNTSGFELSFMCSPWNPWHTNSFCLIYPTSRCNVLLIMQTYMLVCRMQSCALMRFVTTTPYFPFIPHQQYHTSLSHIITEWLIVWNHSDHLAGGIRACHLQVVQPELPDPHVHVPPTRRVTAL